jgi:hypothetical protein
MAAHLGRHRPGRRAGMLVWLVRYGAALLDNGQAGES